MTIEPGQVCEYLTGSCVEQFHSALRRQDDCNIELSINKQGYPDGFLFRFESGAKPQAVCVPEFFDRESESPADTAEIIPTVWLHLGETGKRNVLSQKAVNVDAFGVI